MKKITINHPHKKFTFVSKNPTLFDKLVHLMKDPNGASICIDADGMRIAIPKEIVINSVITEEDLHTKSGLLHWRKK